MLYLKRFLLIASNLGFLFSAYVCFNNNKHGAFLVFASICLISSLYHACKNGSFDEVDIYDGFCMLGYDIPFAYYYKLDFFTTQMTIPVVVWYVLRPFKLFLLIKTKNRRTSSVGGENEGNDSEYREYRVFSRSGEKKKKTILKSNNWSRNDRKNTKFRHGCLRVSLKRFYARLKRFCYPTKKKKIVLHEKNKGKKREKSCEKYVCEKKVTKIDGSNTDYIFDDSLTYECVSMPTVFKALHDAYFKKHHYDELNSKERRQKKRRKYKSSLVGSKFVTDSWYFENAYIVASAIILWEFIDYFGPSIPFVTVPLLVIHGTFVLVVLYTDKAIHERHVTELSQCEYEECDKVATRYSDAYVFGYDTYNSLRLSLFGKRYTVSKKLKNEKSSSDSIIIFDDNGGYFSKKNRKGCCKYLKPNHSQIIVGALLGILGLNLFEIQDHVNPNYYPVLHTFWHLCMAAGFYLLFFNGK